MNKKIISAIAVALFITPIAAVSAKAETHTPTLAILDTGLDTSVQYLSGKIAYEACVLGWDSCANGKSFMEGPGAASIPSSMITKNGWDHGTLMTSVAVKHNSNLKIVFVRVIGNTPTGGRQIVTESALAKAFDWVYTNKDKFNIQAISFSQGRQDILGKTADYCPKTLSMRASISKLISAGVPTFAATGNNRNYSKIDWPSCIQDTISVGATTEQDEIAIYSNTDAKLMDFVARGVVDDIMGVGDVSSRIAGTSVSAQIAAAQWIYLKQLKPTLSTNDLYSLLLKTAVPVKGPSTVIGNLINLNGAING